MTWYREFECRREKREDYKDSVVYSIVFQKQNILSQDLSNLLADVYMYIDEEKQNILIIQCKNASVSHISFWYIFFILQKNI